MSRIAIAGCTGRMGVALIHAAIAHDAVSSVIGSVRSDNLANASSQLGMFGINADHIQLTDDLNALMKADAVIDFTRPELTLDLAKRAAKKKVPFVSGTTGLTPEQFNELREHAKHIPIIWSANMSVGVNVLLTLVEKAAAALDDRYDIEIVEMHHRQKVDAPSGTALALGLAAAEGRQVVFSEQAILSREGMTGPRPAGAIGFATLRGGQVIGDHTVMFAGEHDRIELTHRSQGRDIYAQGAIRAALWAQTQSAGFYSMKDVLGLAA